MSDQPVSPALTEQEVGRVAALLRARAGFRHDPLLLGRLPRCIHDAAVDAGQPLRAYLAALSGDDQALQQLVDRVTIQESRFFRDERQFETLARDVLPAMPPGVIWSAGCANGQEPWSLAITLLESGRTDCSILATDISTAALRRAEEGRYHARELRGLTPARRDRWFVERDGRFEVGPDARRLVRFAHHNLAAGAVPVPAGQCPVVFCRNVIIYFPDDEITTLLGRIAAGLGPGGLLFLGYSETLSWLQSPFERIRLGDTFVYRVAGGGKSASDAPTRASRPSAERHQRGARRPTPRMTPPTTVQAPSTEPAQGSDPGRADPFLTEGREAFAAGDAAGAVAAFRKAAYLRPGDGTVALHLAFAFDASGDTDSARRWFRLAHEAIATSGAGPVLEGWSADELTRLLERKLALRGGDE